MKVAANIDKLLDSLTYNERIVIEHYYGFNGERYNLRQIAELMNLSNARIGQLKNASLAKLKRKLRHKKFLDEYKVYRHGYITTAAATLRFAK